MENLSDWRIRTLWNAVRIGTVQCVLTDGEIPAEARPPRCRFFGAEPEAWASDGFCDRKKTLFFLGSLTGYPIETVRARFRTAAAHSVCGSALCFDYADPGLLNDAPDGEIRAVFDELALDCLLGEYGFHIYEAVDDASRPHYHGVLAVYR